MEFLTQLLPEESLDGKTGKVWVNMEQVETVRWDEEKKVAVIHFASGRIIEVKDMYRTAGWGNP